MKKLLLSVLGTTILCLSTNAQNVTIPDANFKAYLVANTLINTNGDGEIQVDEAASFQGTIDVGSVGSSSMNISDLTGIEAFDSITQLHCDRNQLTSLDLSNNTFLTIVDCQKNNLTSLNLGSIQLSYLTCNDNQLTTLDASGVHVRVNCKNNNLTSLDVINNSSQLNEINCTNNQITTLDVSNNTNLQVLKCDSNQLTTLNISNTVLHTFYCGSNNLTTLDVSGTTQLITLSCYENQIAALDVTGNADLNAIICNNNALTSLDLSGNSRLKSLNCDTNNLTALDVSNNDSLTFLVFAGNLVASIDLSNLKDLEYLDLGKNALTALNLNNNSKLEVLLCQMNDIVSLDVSNNPLVNYVLCVGNSLTYLNVANGNNTNFVAMICMFNAGLSCIYVDDAAYSTTNWASFKDLSATFSDLNHGITQSGAVLTANTAGATYQWVDCDNGDAAISGETNQTFSPSVNGNYACIVDDGTCDAKSDCIAVSSVGIDPSLSNEITIYPNPCHSLLTIEFTGLQGYELSIVDFTGKKVKTVDAKVKSINLSDLPNGVYMLKIQFKNDIAYKRFVKN